MGAAPKGSAARSRKARVGPPGDGQGPVRSAQRPTALDEGRLWQRRMRTLALRLPKGRTRRDRSGAPMKRG
jgi:hypothetical protein